MISTIICLEQVLCCAPSNVAVDNLVEKLVSLGVKVVRLGHPARVLEHIQRFSLDAILDGSDGRKIVKDVRCDMNNTVVSVDSTRVYNIFYGWSYSEITERNDSRQRQEQKGPLKGRVKGAKKRTAPKRGRSYKGSARGQ